jgi:hypothetical protein
MTSSKEKTERILNAFVQIHAAQPTPSVSPMWKQGVMKQIRLNRAMENREPADNPAALFTSLMFRFAGAGTAIGVALLLYSLHATTGLDAEVVRTMVQDPLNLLPLDALILS